MKMENLKIDLDNSLDVLFKLEKASSRNQTLLEKGRTIYLQIALFKVPFVSGRKRKYLKLCHSLYGDDPEICLFVPNRKTGVNYKKTTDEFIDFCVEYYTELLEKHKVKGISTVMPLKQLKCEYSTYELRRKLVNRFDLFLCKKSLLYNDRFLSGLGKIFIKANKEPLGISFPDANVDYDPSFSNNVEKALFTTTFSIKPFSDNYSIPIGTLSNSKKELRENLKSVLDQLVSEKIIPGGLKNIKTMYLWPSQSKTIPLYMSSDVPINSSTPRVRSSKKRLEAVSGEISTQPGKKVTVTPGGEVFVTRDDGQPESEDPESEDFEDGGSSEEDQESDENVKPNLKAESSYRESESESESDEEIEKKEQRLLNLRKRQNEEEGYCSPNKIMKNEEDEYYDDDDSNGDKDTESEKKEKKATKKKKIKYGGNVPVSKKKEKKINLSRKKAEKKTANETK